MTNTRELIRKTKLLFGKSITIKLVVGSFKDQSAIGAVVHDWSIAGLEMQMLVCWCRSWLQMRELIWRCLLLGDAGAVAASACCLEMLVFAAWWCGYCCLVLLEAVLQVLLQSDWLLRRRLVISARGVVRRPECILRRLSEIALKRAGL